MTYPKNQTYVIIPWIIGETRFPEFYAVARRNNPKKLWIWHYDQDAGILKEFVEDPDCETLTHDEALEKMKTHNWQPPEEEL